MEKHNVKSIGTISENCIPAVCFCIVLSTARISIKIMQCKLSISQLISLSYSKNSILSLTFSVLVGWFRRYQIIPLKKNKCLHILLVHANKYNKCIKENKSMEDFLIIETCRAGFLIMIKYIYNQKCYIK